ncbi:glycosyltransferase family 4 protein [Dietzia sp. SL131]|uniref:glycosyltransferase family 4 protein n=1 Tax=Dietzia sp. SL131 TaxID=2995149 RepID=UPI00227B7726|nr:glycosyltransferase family 4 protein [Dietzia sp. SL131]MCY1657971.1 glycosyltransferase family 4 protein [Dietzia sp. SL131]
MRNSCFRRVRGRGLSIFILRPRRTKLAPKVSSVNSGGRSSAPTTKHVWIVNHHAVLPSKDGGRARHFNLAKCLPECGWTSSLIVASTRHSDGRQALEGLKLKKRDNEEGVETLWVRTNAYGQSLALRFLGMVVFSANLLRPGITRDLQRPDVVLGSTVHPFAAWAAFCLARRNEVPFVYEIRDVWPESLHDIAGISKRHPISILMTLMDSFLIRRASLVVSPLPNANLHLREMGFPDKPFLWVSNGTEVPPGTDELADCPGRPFTYMYLGAHGRANDLEHILAGFERACEIDPESPPLLRLVGDGSRKRALAEQAASLKCAARISFEDRIPKSQVLARAREADCLVASVPEKAIYRFGVSPNKYFMYMSASRPVITASNAPKDPIRDSRAGLAVAGEDVEALARAMVKMKNLPLRDRREFARNGRAEIEARYTFGVLAKKLAKGLEAASAHSL